MTGITAQCDQLRTSRSVPDRRVTRSRSRYSSSGITYLRLRPVSSLNARHVEARAGRPASPHLGLERVERGRACTQPVPTRRSAPSASSTLARRARARPRRARPVRGDLIHVHARQARRRAPPRAAPRARRSSSGVSRTSWPARATPSPADAGRARARQVARARARTRLGRPRRRPGAAAPRAASPPSAGCSAWNRASAARASAGEPVERAAARAYQPGSLPSATTSSRPRGARASIRRRGR